MSFKQLKEAGLILPEDEWGKLKFQKPHYSFAILVIFILSFASCVVMYIGNGSLITWLGLFAFIISLALFTFFSIKSINLQITKLENYFKAKNKEYLLED